MKALGFLVTKVIKPWSATKSLADGGAARTTPVGEITIIHVDWETK
jgi:hypothetical protein